MEAVFCRPAPAIGVPQRGQLVLVRAGDSGNPQLVHFMISSS